MFKTFKSWGGKGVSHMLTKDLPARFIHTCMHQKGSVESAASAHSRAYISSSFRTLRKTKILL